MKVLRRQLCLLSLLCILILQPLSCAASGPPPEETYVPWINECTDKVKKALGAELPAQFSKDNFFSCVFCIDRDGFPYKVMLGKSSGDAAKDEQIIGLLLGAAPYPKCPVPEVDAIQVVLLNGVKLVYVSNPVTCERYSIRSGLKILSGDNQVLLDRQELRKYYFPFQDCVVATIGDISVKEFGKFSRALISAETIKVVRGNCRKGKAVFALVELTNILNKSLKELDGHSEQVVLAFRPSPGRSEMVPEGALSIEGLQVLGSAKRLSDEDLSVAIGPVETDIYPYSDCLLVTITDILGQDGSSVEVEFRLDEQLVGDRRSMEGVTRLVVDSKLLPAKPLGELKGSQCIWELKGSRHVLDSSNCHCPFAEQSFTADDLLAFRSKMKLANAAVSKRKAALVSMLRQRWPLYLIKAFCKSESRCPDNFPSMTCPDNGDIWSGYLYPDDYFRARRCAVFWEAAVLDGIPYQSQISVRPVDNADCFALAQPGNWIVEREYCPPIGDVSLSRAQFEILRVSQILWNIAATSRTHAAEKLDLQWSKRDLGSERFEPFRNRVYARYSCILGDGNKLEAKLLTEGTIKSIDVNGRADGLWNQGLKQVRHKLDLVNDTRARKLELQQKLNGH